MLLAKFILQPPYFPLGFPEISLELELQVKLSGYIPSQGFCQSAQTAARQACVTAACARPSHGAWCDGRTPGSSLLWPGGCKDSAFPFHKTGLNPSSLIENGAI